MDNTLRVGKILRRLRKARVILSSEDRECTQISEQALSLSRALKKPVREEMSKKYSEVKLKPLNEEWNDYVAYQKELRAGKMLKPAYEPTPPGRIPTFKVSGIDYEK